MAGEWIIDLVKKAGWWIADYAYAVYWQFRAAFGRQKADAFASGDAAPLLILPGVYETWRFMQPLITALHDRGHPVHVLDALEHNRRPVHDAARVVEEFLETNRMTDVIVVAHSKGGLAGKLAMAGASGERIRAMLAVATPFGGSRYARLLPVRSLWAFSPSDPSIVELATHLEVNERIVSVYAAFDPHIPEGSELIGARKNVRIETGGHFRILADPRVVAEVAALSER
ncbi:pimeloyl-ACP methyl ester carboxylesterase [Microbacterium phyllosphaerae]|uniref:Pimeloyl-ACP methyl ester carboxylesterase n=1 Tax=Microbacterium phyllosphaerae TaxID=124798 RepID=A0ABS4WRC9_9MICO|nr:pimeloyl-ACP methyl ester carboxylesterase [Microbacterium phyllosphaerae]